MFKCDLGFCKKINFKKINKDTVLIAIAVVAVIVTGVLIFAKSNKGFALPNIFGSSIEQVGQKAIDYINDNQLSQTPASLVSVSEVSGLVKVKIKIGENEFDSYVTKDGKFLFPQAFDMDPEEEGLENQENPNPEVGGEVSVPENVEELISCLSNNGFLIYGAEWCGFCQNLVKMFGGYEKADSIYVECTEEEALCSSKKIAAYPTILINDKEYKGDRSLDAFALATNCKL